MAAKITVYGGVGEIGGNKVLIEDQNTRIMLDFGLSYAQYGRFYAGYLQPRSFTGLQDMLTPSIIPDLPGIYRNDLRVIAGLKKEKAVRLDAVLLSHAHSDHANHVLYLRPEIPVYCSRLSNALLAALEDMGADGIIKYRKKTPLTASSSKRPVIWRDIRLMEPGAPFKIKDLEIVPFIVDHSIPGSMGFLIKTSSGWIVYTGDIRFHGERAKASYTFVEEASKRKPFALITEGTNIEDEFNVSEANVYERAERIMRLADKSKSLLMATFSGRDLDRLNTFLKLAQENGRTMAITLPQAHLLKTIDLNTSSAEKSEFSYRVPELKSKYIAIYLDRRGTGTYLSKDYRKWARHYLDNDDYQTVKAADIKRNPHKYVLVLNFMDLQELTDLEPRAGSHYIHSSSTPWSKPLEIEDSILRNWLGLYGIEYHQIHASGHAASPYLQEMIASMKPGCVIPIHTEKPKLFEAFKKKTFIPKEGKAIKF
ncbi:MAG: MBL fold metallo-hydrolase [Kiritimatiellae bacterium]|nr:MBL fold metallo-hydrolase [Kiritimatiellia bacterium]